MRSRMFFVLFLLFFSFVSHVSYAGGMSNEYGKFVVTKTKGDYTVAFVLNPMNKKFAKVQRVEMVDRGDDGEGDISVLLYKSGDKEVFFRTEDEYKRYVSNDASMDVCEGEWSPKIVYHENRRAWACSKMNFIVKFFMWREIDNGLADAKEEDWGALSERIKESIGKFIK